MIDKIKYFLRKPFQIFVVILSRFPKFRFLRDLSTTEEPITFSIWWNQKVLGNNKKVYWPMSRYSTVVGIENIFLLFLNIKI